MKMKCLFMFVLLMTFTGSYNEEAKAASNLNIATEFSAATEKLVAPSFTQLPQDFTVTEGDDVVIIARFVGSSLAINVRKNGFTLPFFGRISLTIDTNSVSFSIRNVQMADDREYSMTLRNVQMADDGEYSMTLRNVQMADDGEYSMTLSNLAGSITTRFRLTVLS